MAEPTFSWVAIELLTPNPWNPNAMDDEMFAKAIESIHRFGFVDPVTVREISWDRINVSTATDHGATIKGMAYRHQIIDGEHRWKAAQDHSGSCTKDVHVGMDRLPITNLGILEDSVAKQLTIVLNETRGEYKPKEMGVLLTSLLAAEPLPALLEVLPFTPARFNELAELPNINWDDLSGSTGGGGSGGASGERTVERVYRLPVSAATKIDEAIREARDDDSTPDWQALQTIAEHFLGP